jgi:Zn-dependent metalloprotease
MKNHTFLFILAAFFAFPFMAFGQNKSVSQNYLAKQFANYRNSDPTLDHSDYFASMALPMRLDDQSAMVPLAEVQGFGGMMHYKFQQVHLGVPIFGSTYVLHEKDGFVQTATGRYTPLASVADVRPNIPAGAAVLMAKKEMKAQKYASKGLDPVLFLIDAAFPKESGELRLAWQVDIKSDEPLDKRRYFVDAKNGKVIAHWPLMMHDGVPSTAKTRYYGTRAIITDSIAPQQYVLRDLTRGDGIIVQQQDGSDITSTSSDWVLPSTNRDDAALDAHFCTQEFYDMMLEDYQWTGLDGMGGALKVKVHNNGAGNVNAFWDGEYSNYGDGDCQYGPLTTLEVVGHEFTHGMIDYTSQLIYDSESGAINESLADMFGKMLEYRTDPTHFNWNLGSSFALDPSAEPFRVMNDPKSIEMPAFYEGQYWDAVADVHTNSSIGNLWFTMITQGKQGVNEAGETYNVAAIGFEKAGKIVFETNKGYLTETSDYRAFYTHSLSVAAQMYGLGSVEAIAVFEAWKAVGVPGSGTTGGMDEVDLSLQFKWEYPPYCGGFNTYMPVRVFVENVSNVAYVPTSNNKARVIASASGYPNRTVNINENIAPGQVLEVVINNWILVTGPDFQTVDFELDYTDANGSDHFTNGYFFAYEFPANDLSISAVYADETGCFATQLASYAIIENESCEVIPENTVLEFKIRNGQGNLLNTVFESIPFDLEGGGFYAFELDLPGGTGNLEIELISTLDPNASNNTYLTDFSSKGTIITDYLNNFSDPVGDDPYLATNFTLDSKLNFQGTDWFAMTGFNDSIGSYLCPDPEIIFLGAGFSTPLWACVDFSQSTSPALEFDLEQFRNNQVPSTYNYSSMTKVTWTAAGSSQGTSHIISGQPEAVKKHYVYALPNNFKGEVRFDFQTTVGNPFNLTTANLSQHDFQLLDNLKISRALSTIPEVSTSEAGLTISPNPATNQVQLTAQTEMKQVSLFDLQGRLITEQTVDNQSTIIPLRDVTPGVYMVRVAYVGGAVAFGKVVVME